MFVLYSCVSISALQISSSVPVFFLGGSGSKESAHNAGVLGSISGLGRSAGEGNGYPLQYSCLENSMDREPGGLQSVGSQGVGHDWVTNAFTTYTTYKQHYTIYVFIFLTSLYDSLVYPRFCKWHYSIPFYGWVIFHCTYVPELLCPFLCWWTFKLITCPRYCK